MSYPDGLVMRVSQSDVENQMVEPSDAFEEYEVLLRGTVTGARVLP